jgi:hypothetical protein
MAFKAKYPICYKVILLKLITEAAHFEESHFLLCN